MKQVILPEINRIIVSVLLVVHIQLLNLQKHTDATQRVWRVVCVHVHVCVIKADRAIDLFPSVFSLILS